MGILNFLLPNMNYHNYKLNTLDNKIPQPLHRIDRAKPFNRSLWLLTNNQCQGILSTMECWCKMVWAKIHQIRGKVRLLSTSMLLPKIRINSRLTKALINNRYLRNRLKDKHSKLLKTLEAVHLNRMFKFSLLLHKMDMLQRHKVCIPLKD